MTALAIRQSPNADPLEVLVLRAWARAWLWSTGDIDDLLDAVDPLQDYAERAGLVETIGNDAVMWIISEAFRPHREPARC